MQMLLLLAISAVSAQSPASLASRVAALEAQLSMASLSMPQNVTCCQCKMMGGKIAMGMLKNGTCECMGMGMMSMGSMRMSMTFYNSRDVSILFDGWGGDGEMSPGWYIASLVALFAAATMHECLVWLRRRVSSARTSTSQPQTREGTEVKTPLKDVHDFQRLEDDLDRAMLPNWRVVLLCTEVLLYLSNVAMSYMLMTVAMTLNVGCFFAICLGLTTGYVFFRLDRGGEYAGAAGRKRLRLDSYDVCH